MAQPKWTDERTNALVEFVSDESPVSQSTVAEAAVALGASARSISSKLRKIGYEVELASAASSSKFTQAQADTLAAFVSDNSGEYTYAEIAANFEGGEFSAKSVQGKILSMELTEHVKPAPKVESVKSYTDAEEDTFVSLCEAGNFIEDIAEALGKSINSARGKALSLLKANRIASIPKQAVVKGATKADPFADLTDVAAMTVEQIAETIGKTARGVKTMLTRRGLVASDYDGASKKEKAQG